MALAELPPVDSVDTSVFEIPTSQPESDGTARWSSTIAIVVEASAGTTTGLGYTYGAAAAAAVVRDLLSPVVVGRTTLERSQVWRDMYDVLRNAGAPGIGATAVSAVDVALWDLHAQLLDRPLIDLLGPCRNALAVYGSGGFTSLDDAELRTQLSGWAEAGLRSVKMKVGREPDRDPYRVDVARAAIGPHVRLMVDANGAYGVKESVRLAQQFTEADVSWFEEPVSSDHLEALRFVRSHVPAGMEIAAGEYGWSPWSYDGLLRGGAVDVVQADVTRCGGLTGFAAVATRADGAHLPISAHCAPQLGIYGAASAQTGRDAEWFADHVRVERLLFDGILTPTDDHVSLPNDRAGHGLRLRRPDVERWER